MTPPANLPADAVGFIAVRPDRPERLALFTRQGVRSNSFAQGETLETLAPVLARFNVVVDTATGFVMPPASVAPAVDGAAEARSWGL